jgi:hypothetical protein
MIFLTLSYFVKNFRIKFESLIVASNCRSRRTKNKLQFSDIIKNLTPSQAKIINRFFCGQYDLSITDNEGQNLMSIESNFIISQFFIPCQIFFNYLIRKARKHKFLLDLNFQFKTFFKECFENKETLFCYCCFHSTRYNRVFLR